MPSDSFSRPTGGRKKLKKKPVTQTAPPTRAPVTDVQSSGSDYGTRRAKVYKKTGEYRRSVGAAKPARQTDATSSGPGYGKTKAEAYRALAVEAIRDAKASRPFDPYFVSHAIDLGLPEAKDWRIDQAGRVIKKIRRAVLPDYDVVVDPKRGGLATVGEQTAAGVSDTLTAGVRAPVIETLEQTVRPARAIAGLIDEGPSGFKKGLIDNKPYNFGKVLKKAGAPDAVAGAGGFVLDVVTDPTTYLSAGAVAAARNAAEKAALDAAVRAAKAGMSEAGQATVARAAAKRAAAKAAPGRGITVKFAGRSVPGVTAATARAGGVVRRAAGKAPRRARDAAAGARKVVSEVRPQLRQAGVSEAEHQGVRSAGRSARAQASQGAAAAERQARAIKRTIPADRFDDVVEAIEKNRIGSLPKELQEPARQLRDIYRYAKRLRTRAGVREGDVTKAAGKEGAARNYFPHVLAEDTKHAASEAIPETGRRSVRKVKLDSSKKRGDLRPIAEQNPPRLAEGDKPFSTNIPLVHGNYMADTAFAVAGKHLAQNLVDVARPFKNGVELHPDDAVFHYHNGDLAPVKDIPTSAAKNGRYVVLNKTTFERELRNIAPQFDRTAIGALFDKGTAAFKWIATATPGFHARNAIGDTQMAYLEQPGHRIPGNVRAAGRAVRRQAGIERAQERSLRTIPADTRTIRLRAQPHNAVKVAGKQMPLDDFVKQAMDDGVARMGYIARELREQGRGVGTGLRRVGGNVKSAQHRLGRWMQNREDVMRIATYKHGLDKGLSRREAADLANGIHIDYSDLTKFERKVARRAMPFYTFSARALPTHAKYLVKRPGKYANYEKLREEAALATGVDLQNAEEDLKTFQSRQAPLILRIHGKDLVVSDALPLTLLNEIPANGLNGKYLDEIAQWMGQLANPIIKDPIELYANRSFFFRSDIEPSYAPLVAAPAVIAKAIYENNRALANRLGIVPDYIDKKTGKKTWGWRGKTDYIFKSIPGLLSFSQQLMTEGTNRRGMGTGAKIASFVGGVKVEPLDPTGAALEILFDTRDALEKEANSYSRREKTPANIRAAALLRAKQHEAERQIHKLSVAQGDQVPLYENAAGAKPTVKLDTQIAVLTKKAEAMKARKPGQANAAEDEYGYQTKAYAELLDEINTLRQRRAERRARPAARRIKQRPLTTQEKRDARFEERLNRVTDADQEALDRFNERLERMKVRTGG